MAVDMIVQIARGDRGNVGRLRRSSMIKLFRMGEVMEGGVDGWPKSYTDIFNVEYHGFIISLTEKAG